MNIKQTTAISMERLLHTVFSWSMIVKKSLWIIFQRKRGVPSIPVFERLDEASLLSSLEIVFSETVETIYDYPYKLSINNDYSKRTKLCLVKIGEGRDILTVR